MPPNKEPLISEDPLSGEALERWLCEEVLPTYDAIKRDSSRGIASADVFAAIRRHHALRMKDQKA